MAKTIEKVRCLANESNAYRNASRYLMLLLTADGLFDGLTSIEMTTCCKAKISIYAIEVQKPCTNNKGPE